MKVPRLVARRVVWFPTALGWGLLALLATVVIVVVVTHLYPFLAINESISAPVLVVEGWIGPDSLDEVVALYRTGSSRQVIPTGAPAEGWARDKRYATY